MSYYKKSQKRKSYKLNEVTLVLLFSLFYSTTSAQNANDAVRFNADSYFTLSISPDSITNCTIEFWVNPSQNLDTTSLFMIGESDTTGFGLYATTLAGAPEEFAEINLKGIIESATGNQARLPLNLWTHLAMSRAGNIWKFYKNGSLVGRGKQPPNVLSGKILIGKGLSGMMDEVRLWKRELTQEEIQASMSQSLQGNETDLRLYYSMDSESRQGDSVLLNQVSNVLGGDNAHLVVQSSRPIFVQSSLRLYTTPLPQFSISSLPSHMQFFARDDNGFAQIKIAGTINESGSDSIILRKWKNDIVVSRWSLPTQYIKTYANFYFLDSIHAELAQYTYTLYFKSGADERFITEAADLVAGDAYYIAGQSNAHPAIGWYSNVNPYFRTFGIQTTNLNFDPYDPSDTSWGYGNAHGFGGFFSGPYLIGVWANKLAGNILASSNIPTCFINGAAGGSTIEQNLPNDTMHSDLSTIYGRAFYRSVKSGLQKKYRALFWYQGEYNSVDGYYNNFKSLYNNWYSDFADNKDSNVFKKIYLFQIHPGCIPGERSALRELQRTLPDSFPNIEVMSTCGTSGHDICHYDAFGYWHIGDNIFRLAARDFYGSTDTIDIEPPNIKKAFYGNSTQDVIILQFPNTKELSLTSDTLVGGNIRRLKDYFYLDSMSGNIEAIVVLGDSIILQLSSPSHAKHITYLPDETYSNDDSDVYEGPWILNSRGIGALSFYNFPISKYIADTTSSYTQYQLSAHTKLQCFPNPVANTLTINFVLPQQSQIEFDVLDLLGKIIISYGRRNAGSGENIASFDLSSLVEGEYFFRMSIGSTILSQKIIHVK